MKLTTVIFPAMIDRVSTSRPVESRKVKPATCLIAGSS
jgi:hypothetical protein